MLEELPPPENRRETQWGVHSRAGTQETPASRGGSRDFTRARAIQGKTAAGVCPQVSLWMQCPALAHTLVKFMLLFGACREHRIQSQKDGGEVLALHSK